MIKSLEVELPGFNNYYELKQNNWLNLQQSIIFSSAIRATRSKIMFTLIIALLAAGHGASAAWLLRHLQLNPRPKNKHWQAASLVFPAGVLVAFWLARKELKQ